MRIAILGAGGIGGYYGGLLARSGHEVAFIARGAHLAALRAEGLRVESVHGDFAVRPTLATDDPAEVGPVDLVLVTVKNYDLDAAAEVARPLLRPGTAVLPLLNGLDATQRLAAVLGDGPVLAGLTHISSSLAAPGLVRQISSVRRITFGERDGAVTPRTQWVHEALASSGAEVILSQKIVVALWDKFLFIASISGVCCLARQPMGIVLGVPETRQLYVQALREVEAVARAQHIGLPPGIVERTLDMSAGFAPETRPSMLVDLEAGRRIELEALNGAVARLGRSVGVDTPVHSVVYAALRPAVG
jgi:2-dehydropantoate 2-reductase